MTELSDKCVWRMIAENDLKKGKGEYKTLHPSKPCHYCEGNNRGCENYTSVERGK